MFALVLWTSLYHLLIPPPSPFHTHTSTYTVEHGQYQQAGELGERYGDFQVLVQLCERMGSRRQLQEYMKRFSTKVSSHSQTSQTFNDYCSNRLYPPWLRRALVPHGFMWIWTGGVSMISCPFLHPGICWFLVQAVPGPRYMYVMWYGEWEQTHSQAGMGTWGWD